MTQYVFSYETSDSKTEAWEESIEAKGMTEAFLKAKELQEKFSIEKKTGIIVKHRGVKYYNIA